MGYLISLLLQGVMFYSWWIGDYDYLNVVTISYIIAFILAFLCFPLMSFMSHNKGELSEEVIVSIRKWLNPTKLTTLVRYVLFCSTITLMVMCNYVTLVVFYILLCAYTKICKYTANKDI